MIFSNNQLSSKFASVDLGIPSRTSWFRYFLRRMYPLVKLLVTTGRGPWLTELSKSFDKVEPLRFLINRGVRLNLDMIGKVASKVIESKRRRYARWCFIVGPAILVAARANFWTWFYVCYLYSVLAMLRTALWRSCPHCYWWSLHNHHKPRSSKSCRIR